MNPISPRLAVFEEFFEDPRNNLHALFYPNDIQLIGLKCTTKYMYPDSGEGTQEVLMTCKPNDVSMDMSGNVFIKGDELWHPKLKGESGKEKRDSDPEVLGYHPFFDVRAGNWGIAGIKGKGKDPYDWLRLVYGQKRNK
ncbi:uncharacterized protein LOC117318614, partial [Pecten maximus]|uniref:uncharacterized protein LOC117318614 n=1 Tax=Pecten maximus TaxID=6579 RepID=UPI001458B060